MKSARRSSHGSSQAVMSTGGFVLASLIMCIPIVGFIFCIIWACGGCNNLNKRNFARSALIFMAVGVLISLLSYFQMNKLGAAMGGGLQGLFNLLKR